MVGVSVGRREGFTVGVRDGLAEGAVGRPDGARLIREGDALGRTEVGLPVGVTEGRMVGNMVVG